MRWRVKRRCAGTLSVPLVLLFLQRDRACVCKAAELVPLLASTNLKDGVTQPAKCNLQVIVDTVERVLAEYLPPDLIHKLRRL